MEKGFEQVFPGINSQLSKVYVCLCVCSPPSYSFMFQVKLTASIIINQKMEPPDGYLNKVLE
jgi:hypothetical protein